MQTFGVGAAVTLLAGLLILLPPAELSSPLAVKEKPELGAQEGGREGRSLGPERARDEEDEKVDRGGKVVTVKPKLPREDLVKEEGESKARSYVSRDEDKREIHDPETKKGGEVVTVKPKLDSDNEAEDEKKTPAARANIVPCPPGFHLQRYVENKFSYCYYISGERRHWTSARSSCSQLASGTNGCRGDLASIQGLGAKNYINMFISEDSWIGLNDRANEGVMVWSDGLRSSYRNFAAGEPSSSIFYNCVAVQKRDGKWYARRCDESKAFVCMAHCTR